jgi:hypothetical protein
MGWNRFQKHSSRCGGGKPDDGMELVGAVAPLGPEKHRPMPTLTLPTILD